MAMTELDKLCDDLRPILFAIWWRRTSVDTARPVKDLPEPLRTSDRPKGHPGMPVCEWR
jgi:hypothetical protein